MRDRLTAVAKLYMPIFTTGLSEYSSETTLASAHASIEWPDGKEFPPFQKCPSPPMYGRVRSVTSFNPCDARVEYSAALNPRLPVSAKRSLPVSFPNAKNAPGTPNGAYVPTCDI